MNFDSSSRLVLKLPFAFLLKWLHNSWFCRSLMLQTLCPDTILACSKPSHCTEYALAIRRLSVLTWDDPSLFLFYFSYFHRQKWYLQTLKTLKQSLHIDFGGIWTPGCRMISANGSTGPWEFLRLLDCCLSRQKLIIILMQSEYFSSRSRDQISNSKTFQIFLERRRLASEKLAKFKHIKQVFKSRSSSQIWIDQRQDHLLLWAKFLAIAKSLR